MAGLLNTNSTVNTGITKVMVTELRRLDVREINDKLNQIMGSNKSDSCTRKCPTSEKTVYKDRLYLAKRRGDPLVLRVVVDGNCSYCKRLVNLRWAACPYCGNGKRLPNGKEQ